MFTGIIEATGSIGTIRRNGSDATITIDTGTLDLSDVKLGDSIATNGVCLTVTAVSKRAFSADISGETLKLTTFSTAKANSQVNLEKAMLLTTRLGGHMVSGHVDGVASVVRKIAAGRATEYWLSAPAQLSKYIAHKGSVTIDGISLTVNEVVGDEFKLTIVPHTAGQTTINQLKVGSNVNLEVDVVARYIERMLGFAPDPATEQAEQSPDTNGVTMALLASSGFIKGR
ncbi:MAG: riboflavin synthase [Alteromonadaceae bacterium]|jgi:riboflavin synthase